MDKRKAMDKRRKIFIGAAFTFLLLLVVLSYDISRRTTFPGSKGQLKERIIEKFLEKDSIPADSTAFRPKK